MGDISGITVTLPEEGRETFCAQGTSWDAFRTIVAGLGIRKECPYVKKCHTWMCFHGLFVESRGSKGQVTKVKREDRGGSEGPETGTLCPGQIKCLSSLFSPPNTTHRCHQPNKTSESLDLPRVPTPGLPGIL